MRKFLLFVFLVIVLAAAGFMFFGNSLWQRLNEPYKGYAGSEQFVEIPRGVTTRDIGRRLVEAQVVSDELIFRVALWWTGESRSLKAGEYRFDRALTPL